MGDYRDALSQEGEKGIKGIEAAQNRGKESGTLGLMGVIGMGATGGLAAVGIASPAGPVIVGLIAATSIVLRQYSLIKLFGEALISMQLELDRMVITYNLIKEAAANNNIQLNEQDLNKWLKKILNYILLIIPDDGLKRINNVRTTAVSYNDISIEGVDTGRYVNQSRKPSLLKKIGIWFSPNDYLSVLNTDFSRAIGAFSILVSEFNMMMLAKDAPNKDWVSSKMYDLLLQRSAGVIKTTSDVPISQEAIQVIEDSTAQVTQVKKSFFSRFRNTIKSAASLFTRKANPLSSDPTPKSWFRNPLRKQEQASLALIGGKTRRRKNLKLKRK